MPIERSMLDQLISQAKEMSKWASQHDTSVRDVWKEENGLPFLLQNFWKAEEYYKLEKLQSNPNEL